VVHAFNRGDPAALSLFFVEPGHGEKSLFPTVG